MLNQFIDILRRDFSEKLTEKTAWGRNELKMIFERSMSESALKYLAEAGNTDALEKEEKKDGTNND